MILDQESQLLIRRLIVAHAQSILPGEPLSAPEQFLDENIRSVISIASCLAFSKENECRRLAYEIAIRSVYTATEKQLAIAKAASVILSRLGNFPGLTLMRSLFIKEGQEGRLPWQFSLEEEVRRDGNTIDAISKTLTDFQTKLYYTLQQTFAASVSAPTSAGKSYIFAVDIVQKVKSSVNPMTIVYVVPTRALIRQVAADVRKHLKDAGIDNTPVRCVPLHVSKEEGSQSMIYVLTQERLLTLLNQDTEPAIQIDMLLVDEAHGIGDGARGIQLHAAIDQVVRRFRKARIYFASPCTRNPEHLLDLFSLTSKGYTFIEELSPVGQNLILVQQEQDAKMVRFELIVNDDVISLGQRNLDFEFGTLKTSERRAAFARAVAVGKRLSRCCCIVYANSPNDSAEVAIELAKREPTLRETPLVIQEFIDFLHEHVHPEYLLIQLLKKRIAFHHSKMPGPVRAGVEDLFAAGHLRYICCTTTLLQGVNLPASDIVIERPMQGGDGMDRGSFLNLIGRAGRLGKEFHGNVWCLRPIFWKEPLYKGEKLQTIRSALEDAVEDGGMIIRRVLENQSMREDDFDMGSAALGKTIQDFVLDGDSSKKATYTLNVDEEKWGETLRQITPLGTVLPGDILRRNFTVPPDRLSKLYQFLLSVSDIDAYIPIDLWKKGTYQRLLTVMETARTYLNPPIRPYKRSDVWLAFWWMQGKSLRWLIDERIKSRQEFDAQSESLVPASANSVIQKVIADIEKLLRFQYAKDLKAYLDVLALVLRKRRPEQLEVSLPPLPLYLECGSSNAGVIRLMALGLTRMTSLMIRQKIVGMRADASPESWMAAIAVQRLDTFPLPKICLQEIKHLILGK
ncbi:DEAD/DEAH box helicase [Prosthecobacter sp.]|uniref:DEAD/DEAH box helicase n=1 Tax=Prosthecobacter sp. TaxID=1965333 RepID=UPI003784C51E